MEKSMDLVRDLWRGNVPLVKTYWLFGVGVGVLFSIASIYVEYHSAFTTGFGLIFALGLSVIHLAYVPFILIAIWRSANKYKGLQRYAVLAKFSVVLRVARNITMVTEIFGVMPV